MSSLVEETEQPDLLSLGSSASAPSDDEERKSQDSRQHNGGTSQLFDPSVPRATTPTSNSRLRKNRSTGSLVDGESLTDKPMNMTWRNRYDVMQP